MHNMIVGRAVVNRFKKEISKMKFSERLQLLETISKDRLDFNKPVVISSENSKLFQVQTFEMATIALFSIVIEEYNPKNTPSKNSWLTRNVNIVREQTDYLGFLFELNFEYALAALFYQQMYLKQFVIMFYRSNFLYTYSKEVDLNKHFIDTYGCDYGEFISFFSTVIALFKITETSDMIRILKEKTPNAYNALSIKVNDFKTLYEPFHKWRDISLINFNFLNRYPFIITENDGTRVPFWPSIPYACTESLMFDITRGDNKLKEDIGKVVFEDYIYHITKSSLITKDNFIKKEFTYTKQNLKSPDLTVVSGKKVLFVEVKFKNFKVDLRFFDDNLVNRYEKELCDHVVQVYKNIYFLRTGKMQNEIFPDDIERVSGIIVLLDDYYFSLSRIFDNACHVLKNYDKDISLKKLHRSVMICPLYEYERILYYSKYKLVDFVNNVLDKETHDNDKQFINENNSVRGIINIEEVNDLYITILNQSKCILEDYMNH